LGGGSCVAVSLKAIAIFIDEGTVEAAGTAIRTRVEVGWQAMDIRMSTLIQVGCFRMQIYLAQNYTQIIYY
jgi:hypothetical protein